MKQLKIIMTGGGSAGHVTPNIALIPKLKALGYEIQYIGTKTGIEKDIIKKENIKYHTISSGKFRRYFDIKNFTDPFRVVKGLFEAAAVIRREKPSIVFSKGGFVSVPVVLGAYLNRVPVIAHESDMTPGLANKLSAPYCTKVCATFPETVKHIKGNKGILTGTPIRDELLNGDRNYGLKLCSFKDIKPVVLVIGGSLGAASINSAVRKSLSKLLEKYNVIHVCGKGNTEDKYKDIKGYKQFDYVNEELPHLLASADYVVSRAGANTIFELLALKKPNILVPLSAKSSRGDQILNAKSFKKNGYSVVIEDEKLDENTLYEKLNELASNREKYISAMEASSYGNGVDNIINLIKKYSK